MDGVRSLILPGNDDGGALHAATGRPRPGPQGLPPSPTLPSPTAHSPDPTPSGPDGSGESDGGDVTFGRGLGCPPPASQRPRNARPPAAAPRAPHSDLGIRTLRCPGPAHSTRAGAAVTPSRCGPSRTQQRAQEGKAQPGATWNPEEAAPPSLAAAIFPPAGQGGPATEQTSAPALVPGQQPQGPLALEEAGRVGLCVQSQGPQAPLRQPCPVPAPPLAAHRSGSSLGFHSSPCLPGGTPRPSRAPVSILPDSAGFPSLTLTLSGNDVQR